MNSLKEEEIRTILENIESGEKSSVLGYFSKPFRVYHGDRALFIKLYFPVNNQEYISHIISNHNDYIRELRNAGIKVPETIILSRKVKGKHQLVIIQDSFRDDELLRNRILSEDLEGVKRLCTMVFDEMLEFREKKNKDIDIGFHPTLRNYCVHNNVLWFFDTFPPMLMDRKTLNRLIIRMSPHGGFLKKIIPPALVNKVTDEYYNIDTMFTGVVGSCCRLRPDDSEAILEFSRGYANESDLITGDEKKSILRLLVRPPQLSGIWILVRKLSRNTGKPNVNIPTSA